MIQAPPRNLISAQERGDPAEVRLVPGEVVPGTHYRIDGWLGEGAMGVVFAATHVEVGHRVALKVLSRTFSANPLAVKAFRDEARASARIGNANIVEVHDFNTLADGRLLMAMELLEGQSLIDILEAEGPMETGRLIGILRQVCKGLFAAHRAGIVHRDVKPDNIMLVRRDGRPDFVKLLDFGISTALGQCSGRMIVGTPCYMAPESIVASVVDGSADMYSVGCMAYELVTGDPPFVGESVKDVLRMHLDQAPVPPRQKGAAIPKGVEDVILRCLAKDPLRRYEDMADLEAALCEAQAAAGLHSGWDDLEFPAVTVARRARLSRDMPEVPGRGRRKNRRAGIAAVISAVGAGLVVWSTQGLFVAEHPRAMGSMRATLDEMVKPSVDVVETPVAAKLQVVLVDEKANAEPRRRGVKRTAKRHAAIEVETSIDESETPDDELRSAELIAAAKEALSEGRVSVAERNFQQALRVERANTEALLGLGDIYFERAWYGKSAKYRKLAVQARPTDAALRITTGDSCFKALRYADALTHYRRASELGHPDAQGRIRRVEERTN